MKTIKYLKNAVITLSLFAIPSVTIAQTMLPEVIVRCTRYSGSFSFGNHYVEWIIVICDNPEANNFWIDVYR
ncbi:hypothetical protein [Aquirufa sp. OSTEICH-129A]